LGCGARAIGAWSPKKSIPTARSLQAPVDQLADRIAAAVAKLQQQHEAEKRSSERRFQQLERQVQGTLGRLEGDRAREGDTRERWAELQGSLNGLMEENQALGQRVDGLDERIWARTNEAQELARQGVRDLQQQLQAFERQARLAVAAAEESQRRQAAKQRRTEHLLEDFAWRIAKAEEEQRTRQEHGDQQRERSFTAHLQVMEQQFQALC